MLEAIMFLCVGRGGRLREVARGGGGEQAIKS